MEQVKTKCASSQPAVSNWASVDWDRCERRVKKLQARIVKAQKEGRYGKVEHLQHILVTSFDAKALAVKRVTSNNSSTDSLTEENEPPGWIKSNGLPRQQNSRRYCISTGSITIP